MANNAALNAFTRAAAGCHSRHAPAAAQLHAAKTAAERLDSSDTSTLRVLLRRDDLDQATDEFIGTVNDVTVRSAWCCRPGRTEDELLAKLRSERRVTVLRPLAEQRALPRAVYRKILTRTSDKDTLTYLIENTTAPADVRGDAVNKLFTHHIDPFSDIDELWVDIDDVAASAFLLAHPTIDNVTHIVRYLDLRHRRPRLYADAAHVAKTLIEEHPEPRKRRSLANRLDEFSIDDASLDLGAVNDFIARVETAETDADIRAALETADSDEWTFEFAHIVVAGLSNRAVSLDTIREFSGRLRDPSNRVSRWHAAIAAAHDYDIDVTVAALSACDPYYVDDAAFKWFPPNDRQALWRALFYDRLPSISLSARCGREDRAKRNNFLSMLKHAAADPTVVADLPWQLLRAADDVLAWCTLDLLNAELGDEPDMLENFVTFGATHQGTIGELIEIAKIHSEMSNVRRT